MILGFDGRFAEGNLVGTGKYIQQLVSGLVEKDIKCIVFYSKEPKFRIKGATKIVIPIQNKSIFEQVYLPIALLWCGVDIYTATVNLGLPFLHTIPMVLVVHDIIPLRLRNYFSNSHFPIISKFLYTIRSKMSFMIAKKIVTITYFTKLLLTRRFAVNGKKVAVINSGIEIIGSVGKPPKGLKSGEYLINNGGIDYRKNLTRLIKAFGIIKSDFPKLKLVITGENSLLKTDLQILATKLHVNNDVVFCGHVSEKKLWILLRNSNCVVYPSLAEGFGNPVLEGFGASVPVISSNDPSILEIARGASFVVNPKNINEIAMAIKEVISKKGLRRQLIARGNEVVKKYNWEAILDEYINLYNSIK